MAKKNIAQMNIAELAEQAVEIKSRLQDLALKGDATSKNTKEKRDLRRNLARVLTAQQSLQDNN